MSECPVKYSLAILKGKWPMPIIWELMNVDSIRFNELQRRLDHIPAITLSKELKKLEAKKIVHREELKTVPPHVEYRLTALGKELEPALKSLGIWGMKLRQEV